MTFIKNYRETRFYMKCPIKKFCSSQVLLKMKKVCFNMIMSLFLR